MNEEPRESTGERRGWMDRIAYALVAAAFVIPIAAFWICCITSTFWGWPWPR